MLQPSELRDSNEGGERERINISNELVSMSQNREAETDRWNIRQACSKTICSQTKLSCSIRSVNSQVQMIALMFADVTM